MYLKTGVIVAALFVAGCSPTAQQVEYPVLPPELADCKFYFISSGDVRSQIRVVRCPNSTTSSTYKIGKSTETTIVIDGVEYERKR